MLSERAGTKYPTVYDSVYMKSSGQANLQRQRVDEWLPGLGWIGAARECGMTTKGYLSCALFFERMKSFKIDCGNGHTSL